MTRELLLCGASIRSLAASAMRGGFRPLCVDFFADADLQQLLSGGRGELLGRITDFHQLPAVLAAVPSEIPLVWAGGLENWPSVLQSLRQTRVVLGADPAAVAVVRDPLQLQRLLREAGLLFPETRCPAVLTEPPAARPTAAHGRKAGDQPHAAAVRWLRKPLRSAGGAAIGEDVGPPADSGCLQQYIPGVPMSAVFVAGTAGTQLVGCALQLTGWPCLHATGFRYCGNAGPVSLPAALQQTVHRAGCVVAEQAGLRGVFGLDFVLSHGRPWFLEVNPRLTASHELYEWAGAVAGGGSLLRAHVDCFPELARRLVPAADAPRPRPEHRGALLRLIAYAERNLAADSLWQDLQPNSADARLGLGSAGPDWPESWLWLADIPAPGETVPAGQPVCSLYLSGPSLPAISERLQWLAGPEAGCDLPDAAAVIRLAARLNLSAATLGSRLQQLWQDLQAHGTGESAG